MRLLCSAALTFALLASPLQAATVQDLYLVRQPVTSQQPSDRDEALQAAFDTLLLRLTGDASVATSQAVASMRGDPRQFVRQYGYKGDVLVVEFDQGTVERGLRDAGVSTWSDSRPALLTWWLFDGTEGSQLIGDGQDGAAVLRDAAQHRGLALRLPLADLDEQLAATPDSLAGEGPAALAALSERYDSDAVMAVLARQVDGGWQATWQLALDGDVETGKASGESREALADAVMREVQTRLAPRYVVAPGQSSEIALWLEGADLARFAEVDRLLQPLGARLVRFDGDALVYHLQARPEQLRAQLALARLQEQPVPALPATEPPAGGAVAEQPEGAEPEAAPAETSVHDRPLVEPAEGREVLRFQW